MKLSAKLSTLITASAIGVVSLLFGLSANASAACLYQYNANGFTTSNTPVFNSICGVPQNIGDESNFVRIRQSANGVDTDNTNNPQYTIGALSGACNSGDKFDVWNYVHNDATQAQNPDVGSGSAVAHNTAINMTVPNNVTSNSFNFASTISASNATSVNDSATLNCGNNQVKLTLVPSSIHIFSQPYGSWQNLPDGSINTNLPLGSTNAGLSSMGNGDVWGCWTYRIVVVYQVTVTPLPPVQTPPTCNLLTLENVNGVARIDNIEYTANSATVTGFTISISNGKTTTSQQIGLNQFPFNFQMTPGDKYTFTATVNSNLGNVSSDKCVGTLTAATPPTATPPTTTPPAQLVNTGPGSTVAMFVGATVLGTSLFNWFQKKRLAKQ